MMKKLVNFIALTFCVAALPAQESTITSGGDASGDGGSVSFTLGQLASGIHSGTNGSVSEGVQQPYEISVVSEIEETDIDPQMSLYPNPTQGLLILRITDNEIQGTRWTMSLYDVDGRVIKNQVILSNETIIDMSGLSSQVYFLRINNDLKVKTFKIIKKEL